MWNSESTLQDVLSIFVEIVQNIPPEHRGGLLSFCSTDVAVGVLRDLQSGSIGSGRSLAISGYRLPNVISLVQPPTCQRFVLTMKQSPFPEHPPPKVQPERIRQQFPLTDITHRNSVGLGHVNLPEWVVTSSIHLARSYNLRCRWGVATVAPPRNWGMMLGYTSSI